MTDFTKTIEEDIAIIKWDCKEKSMNTMSIEGMETFGVLVIESLVCKLFKHSISKEKLNFLSQKTFKIQCSRLGFYMRKQQFFKIYSTV